jgi:hypothetical protein
VYNSRAVLIFNFGVGGQCTALKSETKNNT